MQTIPPVRATQSHEILAADRVAPPRRLVALRFPNAEQKHEQAQKRRNHGDREYRAEVVRPQQHQPDGNQRTEERADGVERLSQSECRSAQSTWGKICDHGVARCVADSLADPIDETCKKHEPRALGDREERFRDRAQRVAENGAADARARSTAAPV